jgi:hypothetical protein
MYEIDIENRQTGETVTVFGYDFYDACKRSGLDPKDYLFVGSWYVD